MTRDERIAALKAAAKERILILDGAMGTMIQRYKLDEAGYHGERFKDHGHDLKGNNDLLVLTQPEIISEIHNAYLEAGADLLETNTFNAQAISQSDYGLEAIAHEMNVAAAKLARAAADAWTAKTPEKPRFVAGAIGPTNRTASLSPDDDLPLRMAIRSSGGSVQPMIANTGWKFFPWAPGTAIVALPTLRIWSHQCG